MSFSKIVRTDVGDFRIQRKEDIKVNLNTREITKSGITLSVGGKRDNCVYFTIPDVGDTAILHNVRTRNLECEMTKRLIMGQRTVHMVNLAFTILKEQAPHIRFVEFEDASDFPCATDEGREIAISLALYELVYHRSTWYERHFGAVLKNETMRTLYKKDGFDRPKPNSFEFRNPLLQNSLEDVYHRTSTWTEFFDELYKMTGRCKILIPWYKQALLIIMDGISFENQKWLIDLENPKIQSISYILQSMTGGRRQTKKHQKEKIYDYVEDVSKVHYSVKDFLSKK